MIATVPRAPASADTNLFAKIQSYLTHREQGLTPGQDLEAAWVLFYDFYERKIRVFAFTCGAADEEAADCVQEVWRELLVRLPAFQLDPARGHFNTWLFAIVQSKTANLHRSRKRRLLQGDAGPLPTVSDPRAGPSKVLEEKEAIAWAWEQLRKRLSECNFQVLQLRLVEQRSVEEVAEELGLSHEQVWYRYHRARRELEVIGAAWTRGQAQPRLDEGTSSEKK